MVREKHSTSAWYLRCALQLLAGLFACVVGSSLNAQQIITVLMTSDAKPYQEALAGFKAILDENGQSVSLRVLDAKGDQAAALDLALKDNDGMSLLTLCIGSLSCDAIQQAPPVGTPVLATMVSTEADIGDTQRATGVYLNYLPETQLRQHARLFPALSRVGVLYNRANSGNEIEAARASAKNLGLELVAIAVDSPRELPTALKNLLRQVDVLWALPDPDVLSPQTAREMLLASFRKRIPLIGSSASWTRSGALYSLERDYGAVGTQVGEMAVKILNGTPVSDIYPSEPAAISYTLNTRTADHMRLDLGRKLLSNSQAVFE